MLGKLARILFLAAIMGFVVKGVKKITGKSEPEDTTC